MKKSFLLQLFLHSSILFCASKFIDFEDNLHPAIKKSTQIIIPEFPGAFNGSIIRWNDRILLCFRERDENLKSTFRMGCVYLDEDFKPISNPHIVSWHDKNPSAFEQTQDPRLIIVKDTLYIIFSNFITIENVTARRMFIAHLAEQNDRFVFEKPLCVDAPDRFNKKWEKNWVPFVYDDELLLSYTISPHYVVMPDVASGKLLKNYWSTVNCDWKWGELRGGTPALKDGDFYIGFFHSSLLMKSVHSQGKKIQHYVMGAYKFQAKPPFFVTHISSDPIVGKGFYHGQAYPTWKPLHVVFPMGCIQDEHSIWVSYGRQDFELWVVEFDKKKLYETLIETTQPTAIRTMPRDMYHCSYENNRE